MKVIRCPYCQSVCGVGVGYYHDEKLNIRCRLCNKIILATNEEDEKELMQLYTRPNREERHHHNQATHPGYAARANACSNPHYLHGHGHHAREAVGCEAGEDYS